MPFNLADSFRDSVEITEVKRITKFTIDFEDQETVEVCNIPIAIQIAKPEELKIDQVDWSKEYILALSEDELRINDEIKWFGNSYKIINLTGARNYGYYKAIAEELK